MTRRTTASCLPSASASDSSRLHGRGVQRTLGNRPLRPVPAAFVSTSRASCAASTPTSSSCPSRGATTDGVGMLDASARRRLPRRDDASSCRSSSGRGARNSDRHGVPHDGTWELAVCSRFPVLDRRLIPMGTVRADAPGLRHALALTVDDRRHARRDDRAAHVVEGLAARARAAPADVAARARRRRPADPRRRLQLLGPAGRRGDARLAAAGARPHLSLATPAQSDRSRARARRHRGARRRGAGGDAVGSPPDPSPAAAARAE